MIIEIDDRLYNDFVNWANANNMSETDRNKYIVKAFKDKFMIDKYGDLNDKFQTKQSAVQNIGSKPEPINEPINELNGELNDEPDKKLKEVENITESPKPKRGRPRKQVIQSR